MGVSLERKASAPLAQPMSKLIYINLLGLFTFRFGTLRLIIYTFKLEKVIGYFLEKYICWFTILSNFIWKKYKI